MTKTKMFHVNLCKELGVPYVPCIGDTEDIITICIKDNDMEVKNRIKAWMKIHGWVFQGVDERNIKIHPALPDTIHYKVATYGRANNNHQIRIMCED